MGKRRKVEPKQINLAELELFKETATRYQEKSFLSTDPIERAQYAAVARKYLFYVVDEISALRGLKSK